jgi:hypothetical protein
MSNSNSNNNVKLTSNEEHHLREQALNELTREKGISPGKQHVIFKISDISKRVEEIKGRPDFKNTLKKMKQEREQSMKKMRQEIEQSMKKLETPNPLHQSNKSEHYFTGQLKNNLAEIRRKAKEDRERKEKNERNERHSKHISIDTEGLKKKMEELNKKGVSDVLSQEEIAYIAQARIEIYHQYKIPHNYAFPIPRIIIADKIREIITRGQKGGKKSYKKSKKSHKK